MLQWETPLRRLGQRASNGLSRKSRGIIQKLTAPPSPQKIRLKQSIFHTHLYQNNTLSSCPPKYPLPHTLSPQEEDERSKAQQFKARDVSQNSWARAIQYTPMTFHSIPSSNIPKPTPVAGCFSSHKTDRLNHKWKSVFRLYFLLLAREKAGVTAQQETFDTEMEDTNYSHGTTVLKLKARSRSVSAVTTHAQGLNSQFQQSISIILTITPKFRTKARN